MNLATVAMQPTHGFAMVAAINVGGTKADDTLRALTAERPIGPAVLGKLYDPPKAERVQSRIVSAAERVTSATPMPVSSSHHDRGRIGEALPVFDRYHPN